MFFCILSLLIIIKNSALTPSIQQNQGNYRNLKSVQFWKNSQPYLRVPWTNSQFEVINKKKIDTR